MFVSLGDAIILFRCNILIRMVGRVVSSCISSIGYSKYFVYVLMCYDRTEDWVPCNYPYTGLSGYEPDPDYCYDTFAESL